MVRTRRSEIGNTVYISQNNGHQSSNTGVFAFIYLLSFCFAIVHKYPFITHHVKSFLKQHAQFIYETDININSYNCLDVSLICALYHYLVFLAIQNRKLVYAVMVGLSLIGSIVYFIS